jgi:hypothetical protein
LSDTQYPYTGAYIVWQKSGKQQKFAGPSENANTLHPVDRVGKVGDNMISIRTISFHTKFNIKPFILDDERLGMDVLRTSHGYLRQLNFFYPHKSYCI